jgi:hypothetical protein
MNILIPSRQEAIEIEKLQRYYEGRRLQALCVIFDRVEQRTNEQQQQRAQVQATQEAREAETQRQREALVLAEYAALHSEIEKRVDLRQQLLLGLFVVAGTFLSLGVGDVVGTGEITLIYPIIAFCIAGSWAHNDRKIGDIGKYIFTEIEQKYHFIGWETYRKRLHDARQQVKRSTPGKVLRVIAAKIATALDSLDFSTRGVFLTSQILGLAIGIARSIPTMTTPWAWAIALTLIITAAGATARTWFVIEHQRERGEPSIQAPATALTTIGQTPTHESAVQELVEQSAA